jgi:hypothetical protein
VVFTLPVGYRPSLTKLLHTIVSDNAGQRMQRIDVSAAGTIVVSGSFDTAGQWISLDGVSFAL